VCTILENRKFIFVQETIQSGVCILPAFHTDSALDAAPSHSDLFDG
jgi:hypothetical protein